MTLESLNSLPEDQLKTLLHNCCGSGNWVENMARVFPLESETNLLNEAIHALYENKPEDWLEAFSHHPKIGDLDALRKKFASTAEWAAGEQAGVNSSTDEILTRLADGNRRYEQQFGYIFIVCATGKSAAEMLTLLEKRLENTPQDEFIIAMSEQHKITQLRLKKLLSG